MLDSQEEQKRAESHEPISFELMSVFIFGLLCARVTCTVCTGVHEPTLTVLFASYRQAACSVGGGGTSPGLDIYLSDFSGAVPCSVSPSVAGGQLFACKTCGYFLLSCIFSSVPGPWNAPCQSLPTCRVQTQPAASACAHRCASALLAKQPLNELVNT